MSAKSPRLQVLTVTEFSLPNTSDFFRINCLTLILSKIAEDILACLVCGCNRPVRQYAPSSNPSGSPEPPPPPIPKRLGFLSRKVWESMSSLKQTPSLWTILSLRDYSGAREVLHLRFSRTSGQRNIFLVSEYHQSEQITWVNFYLTIFLIPTFCNVGEW